MSSTEIYTSALTARQANNLLRKLTSVKPLNATEVLIDGQRLVNFSSNDYLGLSQHPLLKERAIEFIERYGVGSGASRLVCGNLEVFEQIENKLAKLKGTESALIFSTGYQLNSTLFKALANKDSFIVCDRLSHNSLLNGITSSSAKWCRFKHNDFLDLSAILAKLKPDQQKWIVTESVFSMDGDQSDLIELLKVADKYQSQIFVDEAHATGVLGPNGMGLSVGKNISLAMGTFSKACGSFGGYLACTKLMKDYLVNFCSGLIYTTAPPPAVLGAIDAALDLIPTLSPERKKLQEISQQVRQTLDELSIDYGKSSTHIVPLIVKSEAQAINLSNYLLDCGILAPAVRPPTVSAGASRVRLSLSAAHTESQIEHLLKSLRNWHNEKH